jgi:hypothetical protein
MLSLVDVVVKVKLVDEMLFLLDMFFGTYTSVSEH